MRLTGILSVTVVPTRLLPVFVKLFSLISHFSGICPGCESYSQVSLQLRFNYHTFSEDYHFPYCTSYSLASHIACCVSPLCCRTANLKQCYLILVQTVDLEAWSELLVVGPTIVLVTEVVYSLMTGRANRFSCMFNFSYIFPMWPVGNIMDSMFYNYISV